MPARSSRRRPQAAKTSPIKMPSAFLAQLFAPISTRDVAGFTAADQQQLAQGLWRWLQLRRPEQPLVRVYNPTEAEHGWASGHTVAEVINEDMPFLVDSLTGLLNRHGLTVHQVIHPVLSLTRNHTGKLLSFGGKNSQSSESLIHIQFDNVRDADKREQLAEAMRATLADVRYAVADWPAMRSKTAAAVAELAAMPPKLFPSEDVAEVQDFLNWLADNNFTFLGYREIKFVGADHQEFSIIKESGLGVLRDASTVLFNQMRKLNAQPPEVQRFFTRSRLLLVLKTNRVANVHRNVPMDAIFVKRFDAEGKEIAERIFVGLFTSNSYMRIPREVPILRRKIANVMHRSGLDPVSHDGKALTHILDTYPRDELFQIGHEDLFRNAMGILHLQERQRVALFVRRDPFQRFFTCLIYIPRERYDTALRNRFQQILELRLTGRMRRYDVRIDDSASARVFMIIDCPKGMPNKLDLDALELELNEGARAWTDTLRMALIQQRGVVEGGLLHEQYQHAFPLTYRSGIAPESAVVDIVELERMTPTQMFAATLLPDRAAPNYINIRLYQRGQPLSLSDVLPILENMGVSVESENGPYAIYANTQDQTTYVHDFRAKLPQAPAKPLVELRTDFLAALYAVWQGAQDNDRFNKLILLAGVSAAEVELLRGLGRYLLQIRAPHSPASMANTLAKHANLTQLLLQLFTLRHQPGQARQWRKQYERLRENFLGGLAKVPLLDEDRILRRFLNLIEACQRTNFFQANRPALAFKFDCQLVEGLPLPRPRYEIFVHAPHVEGIHLRGGKVARGGIRWSDREDFRTEVLGLMKAQMVKNAVIVPVGSKGGFIVRKQLSDNHYQDGVTCYQTYIRALLSLTDNRRKEVIIPPADVVCHDEPDPYLVVAADKGTAKFSDIANAISQEKGFWLDDAFASGGSAGYDHKEMGITARGAWEAVKRHGRELGLDTQQQPFTVAGVGDMSGDVFGNAMLLSRQIKLVAAFDHRHIFLDPSPDPARSFKERQRLYHLPKSSWVDYNPRLLSKGGAIYSRQEKSLRLSPESRKLLGITSEQISPQELMQHILRAPVDLLYFGGIGTYVKASTETHEQVGDHPNDQLRIDASELRCRMLGEGANLAMTQLARVEYARQGGHINTDAIDNSAGVDTSDHEVNIKIAFAGMLATKQLSRPARNQLLRQMTDEVAKLVLRDNYLQTMALSLATANAPAQLLLHGKAIQFLEREGLLNRKVEFLPDDQELARRLRNGEGLTRPELAVLLAYTKIWLYSKLLASDLPDDPYLLETLLHYFPSLMRKKYAKALTGHQLRREIIATVITNSFINRAGSHFVFRAMEKTGRDAVAATKAYLVVREAYGLLDLWREIEQLDYQVPAAEQLHLLQQTAHVISYTVPWLLREEASGKPLAQQVGSLQSTIKSLTAWAVKHDAPARKSALGVAIPATLQKQLNLLPLLLHAPDLHWLQTATAHGIGSCAMIYLGLGDYFHLNWVRERCRQNPQNTQSQRDAVSGLIDDFNHGQRNLAKVVLRSLPTKGSITEDSLASWLRQHETVLKPAQDIISELRNAPTTDFAALTLLARQLAKLVQHLRG